MTPEQQKAAEEELIRFQEENPDYWGDQDENGVDLARLRENLKLTPAERLARLDASRYVFEISHYARKTRFPLLKQYGFFTRPKFASWS